jgi:hypothetical protein
MSTATSTRIAAGVTAAYLRDLAAARRHAAGSPAGQAPGSRLDGRHGAARAGSRPA